MNLLKSAIDYHHRGFTVIPTRGKIAATVWTPYKTSRPTETQLGDMFSKCGVDGIAVILGTASGNLVCRDYDLEGSYHEWASTHRTLASSLPTVETNRGFHVYFCGPTHYAELDDGEYRGDNKHYCLLPPSTHPTGHVYRWTVTLPNGPLPTIDPVEVGLVQKGYTEYNNRLTQDNTSSLCSSSDGEDRQLLCSPELTSITTDIQAHTTETSDGELSQTERAILDTLPEIEGQRNRRLFDLARRLKALPYLADADVSSLEPIVRRWHTMALPVIRTKNFSDTWIEFTLAWQKVRYPFGSGPVRELFQQAIQEPLPRKACKYDSEAVRQLVALCAALQRYAGDQVFFLACRTAGHLLGISHVAAWKILRMLEMDHVLRRMKTGTKKEKKANEYRYIGSETTC